LASGTHVGTLYTCACDQMKGDPIWVELQMGSQKAQTQVRGSHNSVFDQVFRFYLEPDEVETGVIFMRIYSTRTYGGKQLLGKCKVEVRVCACVCVCDVWVCVGV
jgi:hypothetical protein